MKIIYYLYESNAKSPPDLAFGYARPRGAWLHIVGNAEIKKMGQEEVRVKPKGTLDSLQRNRTHHPIEAVTISGGGNPDDLHRIVPSVSNWKH